MVASKMGHLQLNIDPANVGFYKELFDFLGWTVLAQDDAFVGVGDANGASLWFVPALAPGGYDYDSYGVNHVAISTAAQKDVDATAAYLQEKGVAALFDTPRHRPDFSGDGADTYYQVMFESPDRLLFEVVYTGPRNAE